MPLDFYKESMAAVAWSCDRRTTFLFQVEYYMRKVDRVAKRAKIVLMAIGVDFKNAMDIRMVVILLYKLLVRLSQE